MSYRIKTNINFLKLLTSCNSRLQKVLIKNATKEQIYSLCEIILNILNGNVKLSEEEFKKLDKKKKVLRYLVQNKTSIKKKKYLIQKGGFLQFIIPSIITGIASIVSSLIEKE